MIKGRVGEVDRLAYLGRGGVRSRSQDVPGSVRLIELEGEGGREGGKGRIGLCNDWGV